MLRIKAVKHWLKRFSDFTRRSPDEVVLPAVGFSGPLYDSKVQPFPQRYKAADLFPAWIKQARETLGEQGKVWALIIIDCGFLENEALWLRDQYDQDLSQICLTNPIAQEILRDFIGEIIALGADGVVIDVTDAYPNSGARGYTGVVGHCFCNYCLEGLREREFREPKEAFVGENGLLRLVLRIDEDGTAHIDPPQDWLDQKQSSSLVTLALARQFVKGDRAALESEALRLLSYLKARVELTASSIRTVLLPCREAHKRSAVILGSAATDLTQMVTLQALDRSKAADEYWLPDAPNRKSAPGEWQAVQFLAGRSTYNFNAFFELAEGAAERFSYQGPEGFLKSLLLTSKRLMNNKLAPGAVYTVGKLDQYSGFAGIPLGQEEHLQIVEGLTREVTGGVLPAELLEKFRIINPDKTP
jgi:hypothetical protein